MGAPRGKRTGRWKNMPPWPQNVYERIIVWPSGCWSMGLHTAIRNTICNEETGKQEGPRQTVWRLLRGEEPPTRASNEMLFANCGNSWCINPSHIERLTSGEAMRRVVQRNLGSDPEESCPKGHGPEARFRNAQGRLRCRACQSENRRAHRLAHPEMEKANNERHKLRRRKLKTETREAERDRRLLQPPE